MSTGKFYQKLNQRTEIYLPFSSMESDGKGSNQPFEIDEVVEITGQEGLELTIAKKGN